MGRKREDIKYMGIALYFEDGKKTISVSRDIKKDQGLINYKLVEKNLKDKTTKTIYQSTDLAAVAVEFQKHKLLHQKRNSIEISPDSLFNAAEAIEISIKWFDIKDRSADESTIKYIANLLDGLDDAYFENVEKTHENFKYDYYYLHTNELVPYSSTSYKVFSEVSEYLKDYPECNQTVLPAITRIKNDQSFAFFAFEDESCKKEIKEDIVRYCNRKIDLQNVREIKELKDAFEKQVVDMTTNIANGFASCERKMQESLEEQKKKYLKSIPSNKIISLETRGNKEVETHEEFIEYIDNLVAQYGTGVENLKLNLGNDLKKHYLDGKPENEKLRITTEDFYDKTNKYYIKRAIDCLLIREKRELKELKELLSHRVKFEKYAAKYFSNVRFKLLENGSIIKFNQHISKDFIVKEFCKILEEDPDFVITISGINDFRQFRENLNQKKITLNHLWDCYYNRDKYTDKEKLSDDWLNRNHAWFMEFKTITGIDNIEDLNAHTINRYYRELARVVDGNDHPSWLSDETKKALISKPASKKWITYRIDFINSLFKTAVEVYSENALLHQILEYLKQPIPIKDKL